MKSVVSALILLLMIPLTSYAEPELAKPNVIIVMPDDLAYGDYGCLGNPVLQTPSVDAFMKESLLFTKFHVSPTCAPTRAALMSGRHEFKCGVTHTIIERERMNLDTFTMPQMLKTAGYTTGIFGKWHLGDEKAYRPESRGFDEVYIHGAGGIGQTFPGSCGDAPGNSNINPTLWHNGKFVKTTGYCTDLFFDQSIEWMNAQQESKQPFFAYVSLNAAHGPHVVPDEYCRNYLDKKGVSPRVVPYLGMVENIDTNFGKLLAKLEEWDIEENTLVIYMGTDNGGGISRQIFNSGLKGGKNTVNQGGTLSPVFVRWPAGGVPAGEKCDALTAHVDLFSTLIEITGAKATPKIKGQLEGRSLVPLLKNPKADWADRMLVHHAGRWKSGAAAEAKYAKAAIQNSRFTLVNNEELYDLKADPGETTNVIGEHPEVAAELSKAYDKWWQDIQPSLLNENVVGPAINPFQKLYYEQFGGSPTAKDLEKMSRHLKSSGNASRAANRRKAREKKAPAQKSAEASQPNIVVFLADDMGWGDSATYGHKLIQTPNLDKLASQGVKFTQCYSACGVCSPSRSSILTGRTPYRNGVYRHLSGNHEAHLRASEITYPKLLKSIGYETCHVGKWHLNSRQQFNTPKYPQPGDHGYDYWMATHNNAEPSHKNPDNFVRNGKSVGELKGFSAPLVAAEATRWLSEVRDDSKPFALSVWIHEPHSPIATDSQFSGLYNGHENSKYMGNITQLDHALGQVMEALDKEGVSDNTLLVFSSDNGPVANFGGTTGGLRGGKRSEHEGGIRVPGVARWPGRIKPGTVSDVPVIGTDIFATVLDITGIPLPKDRTIDGVSMLPAFEGKPVERKVPLFWRTHVSPPADRVALRIGDWKLVGDETLTKFQLYEIQKDWKEERDLAGSMPEKTEEMKKRLFDVWKDIVTEGPDHWWKNERQKPVRGGKVNY